MRLLDHQSVLWCAVLSGAIVTAPSAHAQTTHRFNLPEQDLGRSLRSIAQQTGSNIVFDPSTVRGKRAPAVQGQFSAEQAIDLVLVATGLRATRTSGGSWVITSGRVSAAEPQAGSAPAEEEVVELVVTGTRIRGSQSPSRVIEVTAEQARDAGFTDVGQIIRSIPQNFSGGQNPGVAVGAGGVGNQNLSQASTLNLRGLGADATLTLLNGRRLSYNGSSQAVDVSIVPLGALERIEVVADGASAIYGSDAVAGVANIILKRDFQGLDTRVVYSTPTNGGGQDLKLSATGGTTWRTGGIIVGYEYSNSDPIFASQRPFTDTIPDPATIYPDRVQHSAILSAHHRFDDLVRVSLDAYYTSRDSSGLISTQPTQLVRQATSSEAYAIAPTIEFNLPSDWTVTLGGTYGRDEVISDARIFSPTTGAQLNRSTRCYCNESRSAEIDAEGPLFRLPGGDMRVAIGTGYRRNDFLSDPITPGSRVTGKRASHYFFGEINAPLIGPEQDIPALTRLTVSAALRHEDYGDIGKITTPKLGLIYDPTPDVSVRASWGRSFKAPTMMQEFSDRLLYLLPAATAGGTGFPAGSTVLMSFGGSRDLKPERARTWSTTLSLHPRAVPGLVLELGYFDVDYRDRVVQPMQSFNLAFDPRFAAFLTRDPTAEQIAATVASSPTGITQNFTGRPFNPATVVGISSNLFTNVARSRVHGVDGSVAYAFDLGEGRARLNASASWLTGAQQNTDGQPAIQTAGIIGNPARFRARGGVTWTGDAVTLAGFVNHIDGVVNDRFPPQRIKTGSFTTADITVRYRSGDGIGIRSNIEWSLSVQNLLDQAPPFTRAAAAYLVNYDSTNYSAIGRQVVLSVAKHW